MQRMQELVAETPSITKYQVETGCRDFAIKWIKVGFFAISGLLEVLQIK